MQRVFRWDKWRGENLINYETGRKENYENREFLEYDNFPFKSPFWVLTVLALVESRHI